MKIEGEIIGVETQGDTMRVDVQGKPPTAAEWRPLGRQSFVVPYSEANGKTFYVGRYVSIKIDPR